MYLLACSHLILTTPLAMGSVAHIIFLSTPLMPLCQSVASIQTPFSQQHATARVSSLQQMDGWKRTTNIAGSSENKIEIDKSKWKENNKYSREQWKQNRSEQVRRTVLYTVEWRTLNCMEENDNKSLNYIVGVKRKLGQQEYWYAEQNQWLWELKLSLNEKN